MLTIGVQTWGTNVAALEHYWKAADELGYARITYGDGLGDWTHDGWTMLGALAVLTRRARIGPAVTYAFDVSSHHPSWLAKRAVAVDHLSSGRLDLRLAVGAEDADTARAWSAHGIRYPRAAERLETLEESVGIMRELWRTDHGVQHRGPRYELRDARLAPAPIQRPGPPIWIAAMGPRALVVTARCADGWEASYVSPEDFARRWQHLATLLGTERRAPGPFRRSVELDAIVTETGEPPEPLLARFCSERGIDREHSLLATVLAGDARAIADRIASYEAAGATDLMLGFADFPSTRMLELFAATVLHVPPVREPDPLTGAGSRPVPPAPSLRRRGRDARR
jgi:alkanesulfonate monooxygenase SsuD/methylene tetrahydromethanopterin reductase-like flavin-dependent oxidoreductase (luciferase family)